MDKRIPEGTWVVIAGLSGRYIGRIDMLGEDEIGKFSKPEDLYTYRWLRLNPAYIHEVGMQRVPMQDGRMALNKGSLTTSVDMLSFNAPINVELTGSRVIFFSEMRKEDREAHEEFVLEAMESMEHSKRVKAEQPRQQSPLIQVPNFMPPPGSIPRG